VRWDVDFFEGEGGGPVEFLLVGGGGLVSRVEKGKRGWVGVVLPRRGRRCGVGRGGCRCGRNLWTWCAR